MIKSKALSMIVNENVVNVIKINGEDYICLTDMAKSAGSDRALHSWLRTKNTIDFLGFWEQIHNPNFKVHEFVYFKNNAGANSFNPSVGEWIVKTAAQGIIARRGRYGGTYAHKDIAFEFGTWLSPEFKLLILVEFQRLKEQERELVEWSSHRYLSKVNYKLHTDSIKNILLPALHASKLQQIFVYTDEADLLNTLVFGQTAAEWKLANPNLSSGGKNQRDFATIEQLVMMANLESLNAHLIAEGKEQSERIKLLLNHVKRQYQSFIKQNQDQKQFLAVKKEKNA